jgi:transposase
MGLVSSSENQSTLLNKATRSNQNTARKNKLKPETKTIPSKVCRHELTGLEKGQSCPECEKGRGYKTEPASFIRITGQPPLSAEKHIMEQLRCNLCGQLFTAELPSECLQDGTRQQKYGYSARTVMAISKLYMGSPYYRQESLQLFMGVPVTASTIYNQCVLLVADVFPVYGHLKLHSANASLFNIDDTGNNILAETFVEKPNRNGKGARKRTGVYSSCLVATWENGQQVVLFKTNIGHAGEWIDEIWLFTTLADQNIAKHMK